MLLCCVKVKELIRWWEGDWCYVYIAHTTGREAKWAANHALHPLTSAFISNHVLLKSRLSELSDMHSVLLDFIEKVCFVYPAWFWINLKWNTKLHLSDVFKGAHWNRVKTEAQFLYSFFLLSSKWMHVSYSMAQVWIYVLILLRENENQWRL